MRLIVFNVGDIELLLLQWDDLAFLWAAVNRYSLV